MTDHYNQPIEISPTCILFSISWIRFAVSSNLLYSAAAAAEKKPRMRIERESRRPIPNPTDSLLEFELGPPFRLGLAFDQFSISTFYLVLKKLH